MNAVIKEFDAEEGALHFSYNGEYIMGLARSAYWFENRREWALRLLKCIKIPRELTEDQIFYMQTRGLSFEQICEVSEQVQLNDEQIRAILDGRAVLTEDSKFGRADDQEFLQTLGKWQGEMAEVGDHMIRRKTLEEYLASVERSRNARETSAPYERVLFEAGFTRLIETDGRRRPRTVVVNSPESLAFRSALLKLAEIRMKAKLEASQ